MKELEAKAEEQVDLTREQSKFFGLSKNDIIEARELLAKAEERQRKAEENELYKQTEQPKRKSRKTVDRSGEKTVEGDT